MKKKVKFLYIDKHAITRDFFELSLKTPKDSENKDIELVTLDDLSTFKYNLDDFQPDLILCDVDTLQTDENIEVFKKAYEKEPEKFVLCGKIEQIESVGLKKAHHFLKPYAPHDLALQLKTFLPKAEDREVH